MEWLAENWVLVVVIGGMAAMHLFGHGHGHGGHKRGKSDERHTAHEGTPDASADTREASRDA